MFPTAFRVVIDACALFPLNLRDTLLRAAERELYQLYWSGEILEEMHRNLVAKGFMTEAQARRSRAAMEEAFPESMIVGYEQLVPAMRNDEKDRHVAAAAVKAGAQVIVTSNLRDFADLPDDIEAQDPDVFLGYLFDLDPDGMVQLLVEQARDRKRPPITFKQLLEAMAKVVPDFVAAVAAHIGQADAQSSGATVEQAGAAVEQAGAAVEQAGAAVEQVATAASATACDQDTRSEPDDQDDPTSRPRGHLRSV